MHVNGLGLFSVSLIEAQLVSDEKGFSKNKNLLNYGFKSFELPRVFRPGNFVFINSAELELLNPPKASLE